MIGITHGVIHSFLPHEKRNKHRGRRNKVFHFKHFKVADKNASPQVLNTFLESLVQHTSESEKSGLRTTAL